ncbi:MAG: peptidoglycan DD-metalloendopeptidase family protein [Vulcanococcus sp.]
MKPVQFLLTTIASTAALGAAGSVVVPSLADSRPAGLPELSAPPALSPDLLAANSKPDADKIWVKARKSLPLEQLAREISEERSLIAKLNDVDEDHDFKPGDWLVLPSKASKHAKRVPAIDTSELRRSAPLSAPPEPQETARIRFGDNLAQVAQRYNLSIQELLKLNPGLRAARMVVGTPIRVAQASSGRSRMVLGLKPLGSGGLSWPDQDDFGFGQGEENFNDTGWIWPTKGIFTSGYGWRWGRMHRGIDVANNIGTPILAARSGQVVSAGWDGGGYGYLVEIRHGDGTLTRYAHNSRILVRPGELVGQGKVISLMGSTGRSTGPHLHFEIIPLGRGAINPLQMLPPRA